MDVCRWKMYYVFFFPCQPAGVRSYGRDVGEEGKVQDEGACAFWSQEAAYLEERPERPTGDDLNDALNQ